jgi:hypothetical protein
MPETPIRFALRPCPSCATEDRPKPQEARSHRDGDPSGGRQRCERQQAEPEIFPVESMLERVGGADPGVRRPATDRLQQVSARRGLAVGRSDRGHLWGE